MAGVLFFGSAANGVLLAGTQEVVAAARQLSQVLDTSVAGAIVGSGIEKVATQLSEMAGSDIYCVDDVRLTPYLSDAYVASAKAIIDAVSPDFVLFQQSSETNEWVPRLAARLDAALVTSCTAIAVDKGEIVATKSVSGGAARAEYLFNRPLRMAILAPGGNEPIEQSGVAGAIHRIDAPEINTLAEVLEEIADPIGVGPQLKTARVVVSGGLGIGSKENWKLIDDAAAALGAGVGGSRAVVELGWIPPSKQVGFSGVKIRPDVYFAVGISGAVHHLAGISGVKTVVAINNDPDANIYRVARFGVVGDVKDVLPAFVERVKELRSENL
ncbi:MULTISPECIES: electron transfer flavoprotein subunit alpha/FixB family protein [unclassified Burkholderia]|uniref:electron transfer flavoprotein subunit alpha/FixB family protein n=1 Tax=unclassified Burkholderia TaxID=2613784 RepID=UPI00214FF301|nr:MULTISPECIES: electron transfer flavoprotein subunit alpha/FixB family protein [unclassified Burkholderia]MCR4471867.1 electron transfer flavoprotein subunit alpha/FixB family protein [Burkholderia sp. SCN-KJ]